MPVQDDFYANWCGPCRALKPNVESLRGDYQRRMKVAFVTIDDHPELT